MPECLMVDKELFYNINSRRLKERGCVHGRNKPNIRGYNLHILQCIDAHIIVQPETMIYNQAYPFDLPCPIYYKNYYNIHTTKPLTQKRLTNGKEQKSHERIPTQWICTLFQMSKH